MTGKNKNFLFAFESGVKKYRIPLLVLSLLAVLLLPQVIRSQYLETVLIRIGAYICIALGLNILTGYTGLVSLGHAGFVSIWAYNTSLLMVKAGWNFFPAMVLGVILAGLAGLLLGLPTLRVSGTYLSIITLGFGEIVKMVAMNWAPVTNGTLGIKNIPKPSVFGFSLTVANDGLYYLMVVLVLLVTVFCRMLIKSRLGRGLMAVRADELAATMMGIAVPRYKMLAFIVSAAICAMGGALNATLIGYMDANTFNFDVSTLILSIVILGGMGTLRGMFVGAAILVSFPEASRVLMQYRFVLYGVVLVIMMRFRPQGILGWRSSLPFALPKGAAQREQELDLHPELAREAIRLNKEGSHGD